MVILTISLRIIKTCRRFSSKAVLYPISLKNASLAQPSKMKVLNVAEKNDAAKNLAGFMSRGNLRRRDGYSRFNKIYEFDYTLLGQNCTMTMTSVSGHLLGLDFVAGYRKWQSCSPLALFDAPVIKHCPPDYQDIKRTLEREVRQCSMLIIWTDCDREGENIGYEIIEVCTAVKSNLRVYRAKFSEITAQSVYRAVQNLVQPDKRISDAVDVRQELDLRIGAAFTRFQTLRLQQVFPQSLNNSLVSYGSCQFPTLGFVVERFKSVQQFIPEPFWKIKVTHVLHDLSVDFSWKRVRLFDQQACQVLYDICMENTMARVDSVESRPKSKWRPLPLDTVELEKLASRKLKLNAKETMRIAEKLYTQGYISYPRTETNMFPKEFDLLGLVQQQTADPRWGEFASRLVQDGPNPRQGNKSDQAHPPIHPTKHTTSLTGNEQQVYEFVVRHFLACLSKDAEGKETVVEIDIAGEKFVANGLMIIARNYLDVYPYDKWSAKEIHVYELGQTWEPSSVEMMDGETSPPKLLTEADLIALMEKHGIGTDATHADHIETIKSRHYAGLENNIHFVPGRLGMGLVEGYDNMGFAMSKPNLRAELELDLKRICEGTRDPKVVLAEQLAKYKEVFRAALQQAVKIDEALAHHLEEQAQAVNDVGTLQEEALQPVLKCPSCGLDMILRSRRESNGKFISCMGYPACRNAVWFPANVEEVEVLNETCSECGPNVHKLQFRFRPRSMVPFYPDQHIGCVGGCDCDLLDTLSIPVSTVRPRAGNQTGARASNGSSFDSGFGSSDLDRATQLIQRTNRNTSYIPPQPPPPPSPPPPAPRGRGNRRGQGGSSSATKHPGFLESASDWSSSSVSNQENLVVCNCNQNALLLTVRKEGPNTGRKFYKCGSPQGQGCNFFMWADERDTSNDRPETPLQSRTEQQPWTYSAPSVENGAVLCNCGSEARRLTVQKEGVNKGRQFYGCSKSQNERCNFFKWSDDVPQENSGGGGSWNNNTSSWGNTRGRGGQRGSGRATPYTTTAKKKRKCGECGQEGHNKKNCPHKAL